MIFDADGNRILTASFAMASAAVETIDLKIECRTGWQLSGEAVADLALEAKQADAVSWTNLETTPISLSTWNGTIEDFQIRLTAGTITTPLRRGFALTVSQA